MGRWPPSAGPGSESDDEDDVSDSDGVGRRCAVRVGRLSHRWSLEEVKRRGGGRFLRRSRPVSCHFRAFISTSARARVYEIKKNRDTIRGLHAVRRFRLDGVAFCVQRAATVQRIYVSRFAEEIIRPFVDFVSALSKLPAASRTFCR